MRNLLIDEKGFTYWADTKDFYDTIAELIAQDTEDGEL